MEWIKKNKGYILSFMLPAFFLIMLFLLKGFFSKETIFYSDARSQYLSLMQYYHDLLHGVEGITFPYTITKGLGGAMYGTFFYYISSPTNLLVYFFEDINLFFCLTIIIKLSLASFTSYLFFKKNFPNSKYPLFFSFAYALTNYNLCYMTNIMWLDSIILAPLIMLAINRLVDKEKDILYLFFIFLSIVCNYYMGYILVFFSFIYFLYYIYVKDIKDKLRRIVHFIFITGLVGLSTTFILLPCALELLNIERLFTFDSLSIINWNFFDFIAPNYIGLASLEYPINPWIFLVFSGTCILPLVVNYFMSKNISKREKKGAIFIYVCLLLPITFQALVFLWHMFSAPIFFSYRYSFLAVLFNLYIAQKSLLSNDLNKKEIKMFYVLFVLFSIPLGYLVYSTPEYYVYLNIWKIVITVFLTTITLVLILKNKIKALMAFMMLELILNWGMIIYLSEKNEMKLLLEYRNSQLKEYCIEGYRCEAEKVYTYNNGLWFGYSTPTAFLSTYSTKVIAELYKMVGEENLRNLIHYKLDILSDTLLGVKYWSRESNINGYNIVDEYDDYYIIENPYALKIGYTVSSNIKKFKSSDMGPIYLDQLLNIMNDGGEYLIEVPYKKINSKEYTIMGNKEYPYYYIYADSMLTSDYKLIAYGDAYGSIYNDMDSLKIVFEDDVTDLKVYTVSLDALKEFKESRSELNNIKYNNHGLEGDIDVLEDSVLLITIPYEKGYKVYVDGNEVEYFEVIDTFIGIDIKEGRHVIKVDYQIPGFNEGIVVSIISITILMIYELRKKRVH